VQTEKCKKRCHCTLQLSAPTNLEQKEIKLSTLKGDQTIAT